MFEKLGHGKEDGGVVFLDRLVLIDAKDAL